MRALLAPLGYQPAVSCEARENRVDRPLGHDKIGERFEVPDDLEAVPRVASQGQQDSQFEPAST